MPEGCSGSVGSFCCDNGDDNWGYTGRSGSSWKYFAFVRGLSSFPIDLYIVLDKI